MLFHSIVLHNFLVYLTGAVWSRLYSKSRSAYSNPFGGMLFHSIVLHTFLVYLTSAVWSRLYSKVEVLTVTHLEGCFSHQLFCIPFWYTWPVLYDQDYILKVEVLTGAEWELAEARYSVLWNSLRRNPFGVVITCLSCNQLCLKIYLIFENFFVMKLLLLVYLMFCFLLVILVQSNRIRTSNNVPPHPQQSVSNTSEVTTSHTRLYRMNTYVISYI